MGWSQGASSRNWLAAMMGSGSVLHFGGPRKALQGKVLVLTVDLPIELPISGTRVCYFADSRGEGLLFWGAKRDPKDEGLLFWGWPASLPGRRFHANPHPSNFEFQKKHAQN